MTPLLRTFAAAAALTLFQTAWASAQETQKGFEASAHEFRNSCASCHGVDGKGAGFLVRLFVGIDPGDLTQLAKNNEGEFPSDRVFQVIDGRAEVAAHGERKMPVWGDRYMWESMSEYGPDEVNELRVRARVLELVYFIQSIQER
ncbi:MAG: cytochrome c [Paracoccaceae bacterium]|nr:cytochrome c [Paracoccaceae bacterium]